MSASIKQADKILCAGQSTASLSVVTTGGKPPYAITWKGPGKTLPGAEKIDQLIAGQYAVQVIDANGSSATSSIEVPEPKPFTLTAEDVSPATTANADGSVNLKASGGTAGYSMDGHLWPAGILTHKIDLLKPGSHAFVVTDANGCKAETSVTITEDILPLTVTIKQTSEVLCAGAAVASIESTTKGGKPPYSYTWNNAPGSSTLSNIAEGTYTVIVNDATGQKAQAEFKVTGPSKLVVEPINLRSATNDRISDGKGGVDVKGGAGPYTYKWNSGETTAQASKLPLGPGNVVITDKNGCTTSAEFIIKEKVLPELTASRLSSGEPIRMEKIQFDADSIVIRSDAIPSIDELYEFLYDNPTIIIEVSGHTNGLPADDYCDRISTARAKSVADYLVSKGIEPRRVISIGYGKRKPVASNQTPEGRKRNQRVEIRLIKIEE
jgi:outer membrane protein OmpA-like peptidoglycan-associated protein